MSMADSDSTEVSTDMTTNDSMGIPEDVIKGNPDITRPNRRRLLSVRKVYEANYIEKLLEVLWEAFWEKTPGDTSDDFGIFWHDLKPATHKKKRTLARLEPSKYPPLSGTVTTRRMLSPSQYDAFASEIKRLTGFTSKSTIARRAYDVANEMIETEGKTPVNVRTGRLASAFFPGAVHIGRLYSGPDRICEWVGTPPNRQLRFAITVPYADDVDAQRQLIPEDTSGIEFVAHDHAIRIAAERYRTIMLQSGLKP